MMAFDFPVILVNEMPKLSCFKNLEYLTLNNKIHTKAVNFCSLIKSLEPKKMKGLFLGDNPIIDEEDLLSRLNAVSELSGLQNLTFPLSLKGQLTNKTYDHILLVLENLKELKTLTLRLEKSQLISQDWREVMTSVLRRNRNLSFGNFSSKNGIIEFER
jgi:hypothetical protein